MKRTVKDIFWVRDFWLKKKQYKICVVIFHYLKRAQSKTCSAGSAIKKTPGSISVYCCACFMRSSVGGTGMKTI